MTNTDSKKMVIVGGAGFIGSHVTDALVLRGFNVHVIDNLSAGKREYVNDKATLHVVDIVNYEDIAPIIAGAYAVFHFAALPRVQYSIEHPIETNTVNVGGLLNVLEAARSGGVKRVIYSASSSVYGDQEKMPLTEDMRASPLSPYGLQKYIGELYCALFSTVYGLKTVSLRYFNVYGPRQDPEGAYALVIGKFLKQKAEGIPLTITGDGTQTRDFTHVSDVVHANLLSMESEHVGSGEAVNIGGGKNYSINEIARIIGGSVEYVSPRIEPHDTLADTTRAKELLGWEPQISLEEGIKELL
ncbi:MAG: NAD-dependent epimerase/dehydratase family protein [Patescibacteria group bacterium]|nr:NAD-dependent epimerase/dehydratase family protein [Patescibacteria group bacterium]